MRVQSQSWRPPEGVPESAQHWTQPDWHCCPRSAEPRETQVLCWFRLIMNSAYLNTRSGEITVIAPRLRRWRWVVPCYAGWVISTHVHPALTTQGQLLVGWQTWEKASESTSRTRQNGVAVVMTAGLKRAKGFSMWFYLWLFSWSEHVPQEFQCCRRVYKLTPCPQH